ncbi:HIRAN domain-containing protein [Pseudodesulfovibrio senegalensis]|uniref:HIRAN domain-containing protein n=1 Tax=Pseudodesulfovibrio senegalensis TaxID=1721087 RepID=A0A6N6MZJ0_9BACT|nr:HIRAN domain-containing protein [Pseudodesulfovibrio senegalensis]KAB1439009.1 hypothetical protein F8A88_14925 [Pseudodesulfovibrio senegalensis]
MGTGKKLFVAVKDVPSNAWIPVGTLSFSDGAYKFQYTKGVQRIADFVPFGRMRDISKEYFSNELFALFKNRILTPSRSDYDQYLAWLNLEKENADELSILAISGGERRTDNIEIFPMPTMQDGRYCYDFFSHGIRHMCDGCQDRINALKAGDRLFLCADKQNLFHSEAWMLRTDTPKALVGYLPRFFSHDLSTLFELISNPDDISIRVVQVNEGAPIQFKLLCRLEAPWPEGFKPLSSKDFLPYQAS